jgi:hypothetical protein
MPVREDSPADYPDSQNQEYRQCVAVVMRGLAELTQYFKVQPASEISTLLDVCWEDSAAISRSRFLVQESLSSLAGNDRRLCQKYQAQRSRHQARVFPRWIKRWRGPTHAS